MHTLSRYNTLPNVQLSYGIVCLCLPQIGL